MRVFSTRAGYSRHHLYWERGELNLKRYCGPVALDQMYVQGSQASAPSGSHEKNAFVLGSIELAAKSFIG